MCLGDVARVVELAGPARAVVQLGGTGTGRRLVASLLTLDVPVAAGDWVLVHSGFALSRLTPDEAADALTIRTSDLSSPPGPTSRPAPSPNPALTPKDLP